MGSTFRVGRLFGIEIKVDSSWFVIVGLITWSLAGLLIFARQNWLMGDRHRAVARERDLRREMVRRNAELAALTDLASAVTQMRDERSLVDRGLQVLLRVADDWTPIYDRTDAPGFYVAMGTSGNSFKNAPLAGCFLAAIVVVRARREMYRGIIRQ